MGEALLSGVFNSFRLYKIISWESGSSFNSPSSNTLTINPSTPLVIAIPRSGGACSIIPADGSSVNLTYVWNGGSTSNFANGVFSLSEDGTILTCQGKGNSSWAQIWDFYSIRRS